MQLQNVLQLLCRAGSPNAPVKMPVYVLDSTLNNCGHSDVPELLTELERQGLVTLERDETGHILSAAPTPLGQASSHSPAPELLTPTG